MVATKRDYYITDPSFGNSSFVYFQSIYFLDRSFWSAHSIQLNQLFISSFNIYFYYPSSCNPISYFLNGTDESSRPELMIKLKQEKYFWKVQPWGLVSFDHCQPLVIGFRLSCTFCQQS